MIFFRNAIYRYPNKKKEKQMMKKNQRIVTVLMILAALALAMVALTACETEDGETLEPSTTIEFIAGENSTNWGSCTIAGWEEEEEYMECYWNCRQAGYGNQICGRSCCNKVAGCPNCIFM